MGDITKISSTNLFTRYIITTPTLSGLRLIEHVSCHSSDEQKHLLASRNRLVSILF